MKKIVAFLVSILSLVAMTACTTALSNTKVRVVALSYSTSNTELAMKPENNQIKLLSKKLLADEVEEYIFPGDILTFTIELEDPNFEFISLLSIKFNDQVIRANVDNSIVTTRDCGANICVDFPFEISADKSEYTVQEVKFAKLNSDSGVNAIIDNQSDRTIALEIYTNEIYPYVVESVQLLNDSIQNMLFFNDGVSLTVDEENRMLNYRRFQIVNFSASVEPYFRLILNDNSYYSENDWNDIVFNWNTYTFDHWTYNGINGIQEQPQFIDILHYGMMYGPNTPDDYPTELRILYFENEYKDMFFYNVGNSIYVDILGKEHFVIEIVQHMKIIIPSGYLYN